MPASAAPAGSAPRKALLKATQPMPLLGRSQLAGRAGQAGQAGQVGRAGQAGPPLKARPVAVPAPGGLAATRKALAAAAFASDLEQNRAATARTTYFNSIDAQAQDVAIANAAHVTRQRQVAYAVQYAPQYAPQNTPQHAPQNTPQYAPQYAPQLGVAGAAASSGGHGGRDIGSVSDDDGDSVLLAASQAFEAGQAIRGAVSDDDGDGDSVLLAASQAFEAGQAIRGAVSDDDGDGDSVLLAASQAFEAEQAAGGARNDTATVGTAASGNATSRSGGRGGAGGRAIGSVSDDDGDGDSAQRKVAKALVRARAARASRAALKASDAAAEVGGMCVPRRTFEVQQLLLQGSMIRIGQVYESVASLEMAAREVANATGNAIFCHIECATASFGTLGGDIYWQHSRSTAAKRRRDLSSGEEENELPGQNEMGVTAGDGKLGCGEGGKHMRIIAKRTAPGAPTWTVTEFTQPSLAVTSRFKDSGLMECAYSSETLGAVLRDYVALADEDGLSAHAVKAVLKDWLNEDTMMRPDEWASRICVCAVHQRFGKPADNIGRLPALAESLRKDGHVVNIAWCDGERVVGSLMAVLAAEHDRSFNSAQQVARDRFAGDLARLDKTKYPITAQWGPGNEAAVRAEWANLIKTATAPGRQYLESLFWAPARAVKNAHAMLRFVGADACHMSDKGDAYTLFSLLGLTSNKNTVVWAYVWLNTNERTESWQAVLQFVKTNYPSMVGKDARFVMVADGDKGLRSAWRLELEQEGVGFFLCAKHRAATMTGKGSQSLYSMLVEKPTQALLQSALLSGELSLQAAVAAFPHEEQFISARVRDGRYSTFGRSTTQFVEGGSYMQAGSLANY